MAAPTKPATPKFFLANSEPSTHGHISAPSQCDGTRASTRGDKTRARRDRIAAVNREAANEIAQIGRERERQLEAAVNIRTAQHALEESAEDVCVRREKFAAALHQELEPLIAEQDAAMERAADELLHAMHAASELGHVIGPGHLGPVSIPVSVSDAAGPT